MTKVVKTDSRSSGQKKSRNDFAGAGKDSDTHKSSQIKPNDGDYDVDAVLIILVDDIFDKYDEELDGEIRWPKGIDEIYRWADNDLGCNPNDPAVSNVLSTIGIDEMLTKEELLAKLRLIR